MTILQYCAGMYREFIDAALSDTVQLDWTEIQRLAETPNYRVVDEVYQLVREVSRELKVSSPYDPAR